MNDKVKSFVSKAILELLDNNVGINLPRKKRVRLNNDDSSNGYFCENPLEFACAMFKPQKKWLPIFLHEFCHFKQWKENSKLWKNLEVSCNSFFEWLAHERELDKLTLEKVTKDVRDAELDCEKRVVDLIIQNDLDYFNIKDYIKTANSYVLFYNVSKKTRKWYKNPPYECLEILKVVPDKFLNDYNIKFDKFEKLVIKHCF